MGGGSRGYGGGGVLLSDNSWLGLGRPKLLKWYIFLSFLVAFLFPHALFFFPPVCNDLRLFGLAGWLWSGFFLFLLFNINVSMVTLHCAKLRRVVGYGWVVFGNTLSFFSCFSFPSFVTSHSKVDLRSQLVVQYLYPVVFAGRDG